MTKTLQVGLALGGGAARGLAHIGVLEVLEPAGIPLDIITGTSMGALVGGLYLVEGSAARLVPRLRQFLAGKEFQAAGFDHLRERREEEDSPGMFSAVAGAIRKGLLYSYSVTRQSIISPEVFSALIASVLPDVQIQDLPRPFAATSLDLISGQEVIWTKGSLRQAVKASSAIPGFFPPVEDQGRLLVDGNWTSPIPVRPARRLGADLVMAVDISRDTEKEMDYHRGVNLILRANLLLAAALREMQLGEAEAVLRPEVGHVHWADFGPAEELVELGRLEAKAHLPELRKLTRRRKVWTIFKGSAA
jgi:NTE family protein